MMRNVQFVSVCFVDFASLVCKFGFLGPSTVYDFGYESFEFEFVIAYWLVCF